MTTSKADYGIDAPGMVRNLTVAGLAAFVAGLILYAILGTRLPPAADVLFTAGLLSALFLLATAGLMVWSSRYGKIRQREELLDTLVLAGDELLLDVGCGRGLLLVGAARRLPRGRAFGIDLWQEVDQSGNGMEAALANAAAEGAADRVEIKTADMRELPFPEASMDAVISSLAIHNVPTSEGRAKAIREIDRVLRPGGKIALQDIHNIDEYVETLKQLGWDGVEPSRPIFRIFPPVRLITARKPIR